MVPNKTEGSKNTVWGRKWVVLNTYTQRYGLEINELSIHRKELDKISTLNVNKLNEHARKKIKPEIDKNMRNRQTFRVKGQTLNIFAFAATVFQK